MQITEAKNHKEAVIALLKSADLPTADLPEGLDNFFVVIENYDVIGVAGLELYGNDGLLRSLAVAYTRRNTGVANMLLTHMENFAVAKGLDAVYLLTETASLYFTGKGYQTTSRADVPASVQEASEFSHVCPQSAIVMKREIKI